MFYLIRIRLRPYCIWLCTRFLLTDAGPYTEPCTLCLGAYRKSPSCSLCVLANEPPLYVRRKQLSIQYSLKLSSYPQNPTYNTVFYSKFKVFFDWKAKRCFGFVVCLFVRHVFEWQSLFLPSTHWNSKTFLVSLGRGMLVDVNPPSTLSLQRWAEPSQNDKVEKW